MMILLEIRFQGVSKIVATETCSFCFTPPPSALLQKVVVFLEIYGYNFLIVVQSLVCSS